MPAPFLHSNRSVTKLMLGVIIALVPSCIVHLYLFGWGIVWHLLITNFTAVIIEYLVFLLKNKSNKEFKLDYSALIVAFIISFSIPPLAPWWLSFLGVIFALLVAKHIYGGLGNNIFNPAMVGYLFLLISFPLQMSQWQLPEYQFTSENLGSMFNSLQAILFPDFLHNFIINLKDNTYDAISSATPFDIGKYNLISELDFTEFNYGLIIKFQNIIILNISFILSGIYIFWKRICNPIIPLAFLGGIVIFAWLASMLGISKFTPLYHLLFGGTIFAAFIVITDPVTSPYTLKGKIYFSILVALLTILLRIFNSYADSIAFAVIIMNALVPVLNKFTRNTI